MLHDIRTAKCRSIELSQTFQILLNVIFLFSKDAQPSSNCFDVALRSLFTFLFSTSHAFLDIKQCVAHLLTNVAPVNCSSLTRHIETTTRTDHVGKEIYAEIFISLAKEAFI